MIRRIRRFICYLPREIWIGIKDAWTRAGIKRQAWRV
jgi:hypothetical protein